MTASIETAKSVLAKASLFDPSFSTPDLGIAVAWSQALGSINMADALEVVTEHYQTQTRRIMPADVIAGVRRIRNERLRNAPPEPEYDGDDIRASITAIKDYRRAIGDGHTPATELYPQRDVAGLLRDTAAKMPAIPKPDYTHSPVVSGGTTQ